MKLQDSLSGCIFNACLLLYKYFSDFVLDPLINSDTLVKLMEYGDDDDDDDSEGNVEESLGGNSGSVAAGKPFWAL